MSEQDVPGRLGGGPWILTVTTFPWRNKSPVFVIKQQFYALYGTVVSSSRTKTSFPPTWIQKDSEPLEIAEKVLKKLLLRSQLQFHYYSSLLYSIEGFHSKPDSLISVLYLKIYSRILCHTRISVAWEYLYNNFQTSLATLNGCANWKKWCEHCKQMFLFLLNSHCFYSWPTFLCKETATEGGSQTFVEPLAKSPGNSMFL